MCPYNYARKDVRPRLTRRVLDHTLTLGRHVRLNFSFRCVPCRTEGAASGERASRRDCDAREVRTTLCGPHDAVLEWQSSERAGRLNLVYSPAHSARRMAGRLPSCDCRGTRTWMQACSECATAARSRCPSLTAFCSTSTSFPPVPTHAIRWSDSPPRCLRRES